MARGPRARVSLLYRRGARVRGRACKVCPRRHVRWAACGTIIQTVCSKACRRKPPPRTVPGVGTRKSEAAAVWETRARGTDRSPRRQEGTSRDSSSPEDAVLVEAGYARTRGDASFTDAREPRRTRRLAHPAGGWSVTTSREAASGVVAHSGSREILDRGGM